MKLKYKIVLLVTGILIVSLVTLSVPIYWYTRSALENELDEQLLTVLELTAHSLNKHLTSALLQEPSLGSVRRQLESSMQNVVIRKIQGVALISPDQQILATAGSPGPEEALLLNIVHRALQGEAGEGVVSDIYRLENDAYLKTAAIPMELDEAARVVVVVYGGVEFMEYIEQLGGTIFWMSVITLLVAAGLTVVFSRSLVKPVQQLSGYAKAIQKNLHTSPVHLERKDELGDLSGALVDMHTEIKENEHRNKQLLSGIAHEIKNPLGGMELYTGLLREELHNDAAASEYLDKITASLHNLNQTVVSYLDYARPPKSEYKLLELQDLIGDVYRILEPEFRHQDIRFECRGAARLMTDESKVRRVFVNLLRNCIQAVTPGEGKVTVTIRNSDGQVELTIRDNGAGIAEQNLDKIFQPYFTTREKGYGLGLAIAKNIVDELNGSIFVDSVTGEGTCFIINFPRGSHD